MLRLRIPIALIVSGLAFPALGKTTNISLAIPSSLPIVSVKYQSLLARQFNAEIESSIARVRALHTEAFARARNAEINASIARVQAQRLKAFEQARNAEINASIERVAFRHARNVRIPVTVLDGAGPLLTNQAADEFAILADHELRRGVAMA